MTPPEIDFPPAAVREARKAYRWYGRRSAAAANRFQAALQAALYQIAQTPDPGLPICMELVIVCSVVFIQRSLSSTRGSITGRRRGARKTKTWILEEAEVIENGVTSLVSVIFSKKIA